MKKVLVLGAGGMAGHVATISLMKKGYSVTAAARRNLPFCDTFILDVRDETKLEACLNDGDFDIVINAVGILNTDVDANPYDGIWINSCLPWLLSATTADMKTRIVHLSTDCVFSGLEGGYQETDFRSADSLYGRSKALGEIDDSKNITFRTSIIGPDINQAGVGLFNWFMSNEGEISGYTQAMWTGVSTIVLAKAICAAIAQGLSGLYHLVNGKVISKYELVGLFNDLRFEPLTIKPFDAVKVDKSLLNTRQDFEFVVPSYSDMVTEMGEWIREYQRLYPHYKLAEN